MASFPARKSCRSSVRLVDNLEPVDAGVLADDQDSLQLAVGVAPVIVRGNRELMVVQDRPSLLPRAASAQNSSSSGCWPTTRTRTASWMPRKSPNEWLA